MAHFAEIDKNNMVLRVIVAEQSFIDSGVVGDPKNWIQTSYNGTIRKNYAGIGHTYDSLRDAFISPKTFKSWNLDEKTCKWKAPVAMPIDDTTLYLWDESKVGWTKFASKNPDGSLTKI